MKKILAAAAAASLLLATGAQANTLVFDDFESYGPTSILNFNGFTSGLIVTDGTVDYVHEPEYGLSTPYGTGMVDLDGSTADGGFLRTGSLAFAAGEKIQLDFDASGNQRGFAADLWRFGFNLPTGPTISFSFASPTGSAVNVGPLANIVSFYRPEVTASGAAWGHYSISFVAQQAGTFSAFIGTPDSADNVGPLIDNFRVTASVPEPLTWSLMIAGFGLAGAGLRRRRAVAA